jgi:protein transport protein SEC23
MEYFYQIEERDGVRFSFNVFPSSKIEEARLGAPLGCIYTPLKRGSAPTVTYEPVLCKGCRAVLNPYCQVDLASKVWACALCGVRNPFPAHYAGMTESNLPAELLPNITTIEYPLLRQSRGMPPVFLFVVDTCLGEEDAQALKDSLLQVLDLLPENALVGLITFGSTIQVFELGFTYCPKAHIFRGLKDLSEKEVSAALGLQKTPGLTGFQGNPKNNFILPLSAVETNIQSILEELQRDPKPVKNDRRPLRSTGAAISIAVSLMEATFPNCGGRIMVFIGGPPTQGPGLVVSDELKEPIRSHHELNKETAKHVFGSTKHYTAVAERAARNGHAIDLFAASLDQTGLLEMRQLVRQTGGVIVMSDTFEHATFQQSLLKIFEKDTNGHLKFATNATIEVLTTRELKVTGAAGHMSSAQKQGPNVSENELAIGGTNVWKTAAIDDNTSFAFFFEVPGKESVPRGKNAMIQFQTLYQHSNGQTIMRVTTLAYAFGDPTAGADGILPGFDQEACAALVSKLACWKAENEDIDILAWLDKQLIKLVARFSQYRKDDAASVVMPPQMSLYPQFMFHFRRGPNINVFGSSPDETVWFRHYMLRENVSNSLIMIQPTLDAYSFDSEPVPVMLSVTSIQPNRILLLDTFFHVVIFHGETVAAWRKAGYHEKPEYANLKELLAAPQDDAKSLIENRFPFPIFVDCDQGGSQARFILAMLDPGTPQTYGAPGQNKLVFTEDSNLNYFVEQLKKLAVSSAN